MTRRIAGLAAVVTLTLAGTVQAATPSQALTASRAKHAIRHVWSEHGKAVRFLHCRRSSPTRIVCRDVVAGRTGRDVAYLVAGGGVRVHRQTNRRSTMAPVVRYRAKVDPSFTQSPADPLAVTYGFSADATQTVGTQTTDLATVGSLPAGVLNFYSSQTPGGPQSLFCSMNVGGGTSGGSCPITYSSTGTYAVTTQYIPNGVSATTETDQETISPFATTTTLQASQVGCGSGSPPGYTIPGPWCEYTLTNTVTDQNGNAPPAPVISGGSVPPHSIYATVTPGTAAAVLPDDGSCTIYVTAQGVFSPGPWDASVGHCNFQAGGGSSPSWQVVAYYGGPPGSGWSPADGWAESASQAVTVTPN